MSRCEPILGHTEVVVNCSWVPSEGLLEQLLDGSTQTLQMTVARTWRQRLTEWPWRPHHTHYVYNVPGAEITGLDARDGVVDMAWRSTQPMQRITARVP